MKPEYTDSFEINLSRFSRGLSLSLGGYYRHTTDKMQRHKEMRADGVSVATYANITDQKTQGIDYSIVGSLWAKTEINVFWKRLLGRDKYRIIWFRL